MTTKHNLRLSIALIAALAIYCVACGGGATSGSQHFSDPNFTPGTVWNGGSGGPSDLSQMMDSQPIVGASPGAPLGTNPAYGVQEILPETSSAMGASVVALPEESVAAVTVSADGTEPVWDATDLTFSEGETITLWAEYVAPNGQPVERTFEIPEIDVTCNNPLPGTGGTQTVSFDYTLPFLPGNDDTPVSFVFSLDEGTATQTIEFIIVDVPTVQLPMRAWQMAWETAMNTADYDYNDLIVRMEATETKDTNTEKVVQIDVVVKAIARGDGYSADWQFNLEDSFPGATAVTSTTQQYKAGGTIPDGPVHSWKSSQGISIPVFTPVRNVLPSIPGHGSTVNVLTSENWSAGGLAKIKIIPSPGMVPGTYQPLPWTNQMLILSEDRSEVYVISLRTNRGGNKVQDDPNPLGFILPYNAPPYNWPLEGVNIENVYDGESGIGSFAQWVTWWNLPSGDQHYNDPEPQWWMHDPSHNVTNPPLCYWDDGANIPGGPALPIPN